MNYTTHLQFCAIENLHYLQKGSTFLLRNPRKNVMNQINQYRKRFQMANWTPVLNEWQEKSQTFQVQLGICNAKMFLMQIDGLGWFHHDFSRILTQVSILFAAGANFQPHKMCWFFLVSSHLRWLWVETTQLFELTKNRTTLVHKCVCASVLHIFWRVSHQRFIQLGLELSVCVCVFGERQIQIVYLMKEWWFPFHSSSYSHWIYRSIYLSIKLFNGI